MPSYNKGVVKQIVLYSVKVTRRKNVDCDFLQGVVVHVIFFSLLVHGIFKFFYFEYFLSEKKTLMNLIPQT